MRHRNYRIYWFGQIGSLIGAWMQSVALPWLVLELGGSPLQLGAGAGAHVRPVHDPRADRRRAGRSGRQAANAHGRQRGRHAPGHDAVRPRGHGRRRDLACLRPGPRGWLRERHRDAGAPGIRRRARPAGGSRQRDRAQLDQLQPVARRRPGHRGRDDRCVRGGASTSASTRSATCRFSSACGCSTAAFCATSRARRGSRRFAPAWPRACATRVATPTVLWPLVLLGGMAMLAMNFQTLLPLFSRDTLAHGLGRIRRAVRGNGRRLAARLADPGLRDQPAADAAASSSAAARPSWCSSSRSASRAARCSPSRS